MEKLKNNRVGRPKYILNLDLLQKLYNQVEENKITNEEAWNIAKCKKTLWYKMKKLYKKELEDLK